MNIEKDYNKYLKYKKKYLLFKQFGGDDNQQLIIINNFLLKRVQLTKFIIDNKGDNEYYIQRKNINNYLIMTEITIKTLYEQLFLIKNKRKAIDELINLLAKYLNNSSTTRVVETNNTQDLYPSEKNTSDN